MIKILTRIFKAQIVQRCTIFGLFTLIFKIFLGDHGNDGILRCPTFPGHSPLSYSPGLPHLGHSPSVEAKISKLALTRTPTTHESGNF